jgi:Transglycosylase
MSRWTLLCGSGRWVALSFAFFLSLTVPLAAEDAATFEQALEPEAIRSAFQDATTGLPARPRLMNLAFVAAEDPEFFDDFPAQSTLTASITRWYPPSEDVRGTKRHLQKLQASVALANVLQHDEILAWYLARVYLGRGCYGIQPASRAYFGSVPEQLGLEQIALLAALPKAPTMYDPARRPDKALERRNLLIREMAKAGFITDATAELAAKQPLGVVEPAGSCAD